MKVFFATKMQSPRNWFIDTINLIIHFWIQNFLGRISERF